MISLFAGFGWPAVARIGAIAGVALAVYLAFQWFTGVLDENQRLRLENSNLEANLQVEQQARERANRAAAEAVRKRTQIADRFEQYRQEVISEEHQDWRDESLPDGLHARLERLRKSAAGNADGGDQGAAEPDGDKSSPEAAGQD